MFNRIFQEAFQCRTRLCGWCNITCDFGYIQHTFGFNAARGFVGGATLEGGSPDAVHFDVSMPHAALWVVQL